MFMTCKTTLHKVQKYFPCDGPMDDSFDCQIQKRR